MRRLAARRSSVPRCSWRRRRAPGPGRSTGRCCSRSRSIRRTRTRGGQHRGIDIGAARRQPGARAGGGRRHASREPCRRAARRVTIETADGYTVTLDAPRLDRGRRADATVGEGAVVGTVGPSGTPEVTGRTSTSASARAPISRATSIRSSFLPCARARPRRRPRRPRRGRSRRSSAPPPRLRPPAAAPVVARHDGAVTAPPAFLRRAAGGAAHPLRRRRVAAPPCARRPSAAARCSATIRPAVAPRRVAEEPRARPSCARAPQRSTLARVPAAVTQRHGARAQRRDTAQRPSPAARHDSRPAAGSLARPPARRGATRLGPSRRCAAGGVDRRRRMPGPSFWARWS